MREVAANLGGLGADQMTVVQQPFARARQDVIEAHGLAQHAAGGLDHLFVDGQLRKDVGFGGARLSTPGRRAVGEIFNIFLRLGGRASGDQIPAGRIWRIG